MKNLLGYVVSHYAKRFCFVSSVKICGENRGDADRFQEDYLGYVDFNTLWTDSKAISQFIKKAAAGEDIVLKSAGTQLYSYTYALDAAMAILTVLLQRTSGEAYNISDTESEVTLRQIAECLAEGFDLNVVFEVPDVAEQAGYSIATKALLDIQKISLLGWKPQTHMREGLYRAVESLRQHG